MIPRLIHQTWHSPTYTGGRGTPASWRARNPDWTYRLWLDDELEAFVAERYPDLLTLYRGYPNPVQRADLGRYLLLHHFGGVYADMDTDCLAPLEPLVNEDRIVLCEEPAENWHKVAHLGLDKLLFNGTMASPAGHPFWLHLADLAWRCRYAAAKDVLVSTGPALLTAAVRSWDSPRDLSINASPLFAPAQGLPPRPERTIRAAPTAAPARGDYDGLQLSRHNWAGSWFTEVTETRWSRLKGNWRAARARLKRRVRPMGPEDLAKIDRALLLSQPAPLDPADLPQVAVFVPVRDGVPFLDRHWALLRALDWPKDRLRLVYCEGDSRDDSRARLLAFRDEAAAEFAGIEVLHHEGGNTLPRNRRWKPEYQLARRGALAAARNTLIREGLRDSDDWVLWLDVDVCDFSPDLLHRLLAARAKIATPDCVTRPGEGSYDLNAYLEHGTPRRSEYYKYVTGGLFQPPPHYRHRMHMHDLRFTDRVPLTAVGGTALLVHGSVHRAGLTFPERPYRQLIETEAFGCIAHDLGLPPIGLPQIEVRHVES